MFVINPDQYSLPTYRIGPFTTKDLSKNHLLYVKESIDERGFQTYLQNRFGENYYYTINGREAISIALKTYGLKKTDLVTILTTSQNFYISGCVTNEIEKFCRWNRKIEPETKIIFVNHEFGYPYPEMDYLVSLGIPIIEDCCTTFFSQNNEGKVGKYGDFAVYSFPKFFPIQVGGLLVTNSKVISNYNFFADDEVTRYISKVVSVYVEDQNQLLKVRRETYNYALEQFRELGFTERFFTDHLTVPSVLMLNNNSVVKDLPGLKVHLWNHGIQASIFYGEDAFFLPSHQNLLISDVDYFLFVVTKYIEKQ